MVSVTFVIVAILVSVIVGVTAYSVGWVHGFRKGNAVMEAELLEKFRRKYGVKVENRSGPDGLEEL